METMNKFNILFDELANNECIESFDKFHVTLCSNVRTQSNNVTKRRKKVLPNPRFRRPIGLLLTSSPRPAKPYRYFDTFGLLLTSWPQIVLKSGAFVKYCQFPVKSEGF